MRAPLNTTTGGVVVVTVDVLVVAVIVVLVVVLVVVRVFVFEVDVYAFVVEEVDVLVDDDVLVDEAVAVFFVVLEDVDVPEELVVTVGPAGHAAKVVDEQLPYAVLAATHPMYGACDAALGPA